MNTPRPDRLVAPLVDEVIGFAMWGLLAVLATAAVVALTGYPRGVGMFVGIYQLPYAIPLALLLKKRAPARVYRGYLFAAAITFVLSSALALLIAFGLLAA